jgi:hypothetical protein
MVSGWSIHSWPILCFFFLMEQILGFIIKWDHIYIIYIMLIN